MSARARLESVRKLFAILAALAVLFAPSVAYAAVPMTPHHDMEAMEMGHCGMLPSRTADHNKADTKSCCISMCMAVAVPPPTPTEVTESRHDIAYFLVSQSWHGFLGEIATPPPRIA